MPPRLLLALMTLTVCAAAAVAGVVLAEGSREPADVQADPSGWAGAVRPPGAVVPAFRLADQDGNPVTSASLRGSPQVFTFVYSTCEDTCPAQVQTIRGALDDLGRDVGVVAVSVDPANDTPRRARSFLLEQTMTGRMRYLLGSRRALAPVWRGFGIAPQEDELEHSAYVVLVDGDGRQRVGFPFSQLTQERLVHDLRRLGA